MKYTFKIGHSDLILDPPHEKPHEKATWSEEYDCWTISFEDLADFLAFFHSLEPPYDKIIMLKGYNNAIKNSAKLDTLVLF